MNDIPNLDEIKIGVKIKDSDDSSIIISDDDISDDDISDDISDSIKSGGGKEGEEGEKGEKGEEGEESKDILTNLDTKVNFDDDSDAGDDSDDSGDSDNDNMKKIEQNINQDILTIFHPEIKQINYKELLTLSQVTRNKKGVIVDPLHTTYPFLTRYEKAKILGLRAKQINHGSKPFVNVPNYIIDGHTIALMELNKGNIPFIIRRPMPNGGSEYWKVSDLPIIE